MQSKENLGLRDGEFCFLKTHSAQLTYFDNYFTDIKHTLGFIYIIRDPRDVLISYTHHSMNSLDETILHMTNNTAALNYVEKKIEDKIKPYALLSRWDVHVKSWMLFQVPNLVLRYEDLVEKRKKLFIE